MGGWREVREPGCLRAAKGAGSDLPLGRDALRVEAVEAAPSRVDRDSAM